MDNSAKIACILDGARGIYIPQAFVNGFDLKKWHVSKDDADILKEGPDHEFYWDTWDDVLSRAWLKDGKHKWTLYQDGDLFIVRDDYKWDE